MAYLRKTALLFLCSPAMVFLNCYADTNASRVCLPFSPESCSNHVKTHSDLFDPKTGEKISDISSWERLIERSDSAFGIPDLIEERLEEHRRGSHGTWFLYHVNTNVFTDSTTMLEGYEAFIKEDGSKEEWFPQPGSYQKFHDGWTTQNTTKREVHTNALGKVEYEGTSKEINSRNDRQEISSNATEAFDYVKNSPSNYSYTIERNLDEVGNFISSVEDDKYTKNTFDDSNHILHSEINSNEGQFRIDFDWNALQADEFAVRANGEQKLAGTFKYWGMTPKYGTKENPGCTNLANFGLECRFVSSSPLPVSVKRGSFYPVKKDWSVAENTWNFKSVQFAKTDGSGKKTELFNDGCSSVEKDLGVFSCHLQMKKYKDEKLVSVNDEARNYRHLESGDWEFSIEETLMEDHIVTKKATTSGLLNKFALLKSMTNASLDPTSNQPLDTTVVQYEFAPDGALPAALEVRKNGILVQKNLWVWF